MTLEELLVDRFAAAFEAVAGERVDPAVRRSQHADFQADGALPLAQKLGRAPRDIATEVLARADLAGLVEAAEISGPGFINVTVTASALGDLLGAMNTDERIGVTLADAPETVIVDYSAPNVAKEMHVGHLRSTVIGDAAARTLAWLGHDVRRANHVGDWGTPFGMLIEHLLDVGETEAAHELSVGDLNGFYRAARIKFDADPGFAERSRQRVVALQSGDETTLRLWRLLVAESEKYFLSVYDKLDVTLTADDFYGESFYNDMLAPVVEELDRLGLLRESDAALCVFPGGFTGRDGEPLPVIVRKRDGGYGYGATDLAAIRYRTQELKASRLLYVVGSPQSQHLEMIYQIAREAGWLADARATHIGFGQVLGPDGKKLASRAGETIKLADLLDEAVVRAAAIVTEKNPDLDPATRAAVAQAVGIGAIKYADLSSDRVKDYVFHWDRMLATNGDTAAYLQYTYARIQSIFRKGEATPDRAATTVRVIDPAEHALALELLAFPGVVGEVAETLQFHRLTGCLQNIAGAYTTFYDRCPVLKAPDAETRASRLVLCDLTGRAIAQGLALLGITAPARM